jgi:hypothetical protein
MIGQYDKKWVNRAAKGSAFPRFLAKIFSKKIPPD